MKKLLTLFLAVLMVLTLAACSKTCQECGRDLGDSCFIYKDEYYCDKECARVCEECGDRYSGKGNEFDGDRYCDDCVPRNYCAYCDKTIDGEGFEYEGKLYCDEMCVAGEILGNWTPEYNYEDDTLYTP